MEARTSKRAKEMLCHEIEKIVDEGDLTRERLELLHKLTDTLKNFYKIEMAEEYSEDGYSKERSHDRDRRYTYDDEYDHGHSGSNANNLSIKTTFTPSKKSNRIFGRKHLTLMREFGTRSRPSLNDRYRLFQA